MRRSKVFILEAIRLTSEELIVHVDTNGELVNEFVWPLRTIPRKPTELVHHPSARTAGHPDVTIDDPYYISFCFPVTSAHVTDLWIGSDTWDCGTQIEQCWILILNKNSCVESGEIAQQTFENREGRVTS